MAIIRYFWCVTDEFLHKIDVNSLKKELCLDVSEIANLTEISENSVYKWAWDKNKNGTRPAYNAIVRLLQKGATVETLFGVDYAAIHNLVPANQPASEPAENREPIDYQDPKFLAALEKGMALIEERKKQGIK